MKLPKLVIKNFTIGNCIFQGGMGVGVSRWPLAGAVSEEDALGTLSSACLSTIHSLESGKHLDTYSAVFKEIKMAQERSMGKPIGINVMCAGVSDYKDTIRASIDAEVDAIISGAGLPLGLPGIQPPGHTALIPIVSSARAFKIILKRWEQFGYRPDAVALEGPLAGGHLGFKIEEVDNPEQTLEKLLPDVLDVAHEHGDIPVIVAGGIYTHEDIWVFVDAGASGVQMGTRFLATEESSATDAYKQAVVRAGLDDIIVVSSPGNSPSSPCDLPFRTLKTSPMYMAKRVPKCTHGYLLRQKDGRPFCKAMPQNTDSELFLCPCSGLLSSCGSDSGLDLYTVGSNAYRVNEILSVAKLMAELRGDAADAVAHLLSK